jgi:pyruvate formate-lyase activating enzyme-like uncharacterized protein
MIFEIDRDSIAAIRNPELRAYARRYQEIYEHFKEQVHETGIGIDTQDYRKEAESRIERLKAAGAVGRNGDRSIHLNRISPACVACQTAIGSLTFFISLMCHRNCYFCFNANQENYSYYQEHARDCVNELNQIHADGQALRYIGLTGGEPLLHKAETIAFFKEAKRLFPESHTRLYTCGDHADEATMAKLRDARLDEIRFSLRLHDFEKGNRHSFKRIEKARTYIPKVMVEMPVMPGGMPQMKEILTELDRMGIHGINLLEFCFPFHNADEFNEKGYVVKWPPYRTLYEYWYAGGLPISRSELDCLELLEFAIAEDLELGVHYCSLENKHTAQLYFLNSRPEVPHTHYFSKKDYLLKSAKVAGKDVPRVADRLVAHGYRGFRLHDDGILEFHVSQIEGLRDIDIDIGLSSSVLEDRDACIVLRELKVDLTYPQVFDMGQDV